MILKARVLAPLVKDIKRLAGLHDAAVLSQQNYPTSIGKMDIQELEILVPDDHVWRLKRRIQIRLSPEGAIEDSEVWRLGIFRWVDDDSHQESPAQDDVDDDDDSEDDD